ncbi:MAG: ABC transporter permease subunit [Nitriliruptorales bacterium]|nr:ABC transporter permease subunit [Nitriliruptorales bacterium]
MAFVEVGTAPRRPGRTVPSSFWLGLAGVVTALVAVEAVARLGVLPARWFPPVTIVFATLTQLVPTGDFWVDVGRTLQGWAVGLGLAAALAVPIGMLVGSVETVYRALRAIIEFLRPIPSVALIPAAVLLFGIGTGMKVFLVAFAAFWPILFQSMYGVRDVDPGIKETAKVYGLGPLARFVWVIIPSTAAYVATGVRISSAIALILALTAEIVVGAAGLGRAIMTAQTAAAIPRMYALIAVTGILGWLLNGAFQRIERWFLRWHPSQREEMAA